MEITVRGTPMFELKITPEHVAVLIEVSESHYDGVCREASLDTAKVRKGFYPERNGFLTGWARLIEPWPAFDGRPAEPGREKVDATWRELDTCLKILEMASTVFSKRDPGDACKLALVTEMFRDFNRVMDVARDAMEAWRTGIRGDDPAQA